jgi:dihydroneopterin aldolase
VLAEERRDGQEFVVDATLHLDTAPAAATDDLAKTVDYAAVAQRLVAIITGDPVDLIETLAQRLADACLELPLVDAVDIVVHKPSAPIPLAFDDVTVSIHRTRSDVTGER